MYEDEYSDEPLVDEPVMVAPAPVSGPRQWTWDMRSVLWVAGGVAALGFVVWFLMSLTSSRAKALAEEASNVAAS